VREIINEGEEIFIPTKRSGHRLADITVNQLKRVRGFAH